MPEKNTEWTNSFDMTFVVVDVNETHVWGRRKDSPTGTTMRFPLEHWVLCMRQTD